MKLTQKFALLAILSLTAFHNSFASVVTTLTPTVSVSTNTSFVLTLSINTTVEQLQSLSYKLLVSSGGNSLFSITGRDITGSIFTDTTSTLGQVTSTSDSALPAGADNLLNLQNDRDLGASIADPFSPPAAGGPYFVANITLLTTAPAGIYTISLTSDSIAGYGDPLNPSGQTITASSTITVVPEPSSYAMMGVGLLIFGGVFWKRQSAKN